MANDSIGIIEQHLPMNLGSIVKFYHNDTPCTAMLLRLTPPVGTLVASTWSVYQGLCLHDQLAVLDPPSIDEVEPDPEIVERARKVPPVPKSTGPLIEKQQPIDLTVTSEFDDGEMDEDTVAELRRVMAENARGVDTSGGRPANPFSAGFDARENKPAVTRKSNKPKSVFEG